MGVRGGEYGGLIHVKTLREKSACIRRNRQHLYATVASEGERVRVRSSNAEHSPARLRSY